jgi:hypothetical protein
VKCDDGFADLDGEPYKAFLCARCAMLSVGHNKCLDLLRAAQVRNQAERSEHREKLEQQAAEQGITVEQLTCRHEWNQSEGEADENGGRIYCLKCGLDGDA